MSNSKKSAKESRYEYLSNLASLASIDVENTVRRLNIILRNKSQIAYNALKYSNEYDVDKACQLLKEYDNMISELLCLNNENLKS